MPDYGQELRFGVFVTPTAAQASQVIATAVEADVRGLDSVSVQDHPYQPAFLDALTLLTTIAAHTERVSLWPNVANLPLRPPAVLARVLASLDILSDGRAELGLGAGAFWGAIEAMGTPRRTPGEAVSALEEAIAVIRALWSPSRAPRLEGDFYSLAGARPGPPPPHPIGIWLGAIKPRMLRLTGRLGDGWSVSEGYVPPDQVAQLSKILDDAAQAAGRAPSEIARIYNLNPPGDTAADTRAWIERLTGFTLELGISHFVLPVEPGDLAAVARFADEVAPAVRERVETERLTPAPQTPRDHAEVSAPQRPPEDPARPAGPGDGDRLVLIHNHLRQELQQLSGLIDQVEHGQLDVASARSAINLMTMRQNNWTLGTYCESYCRVVTTHHTIEDTAMFPAVRSHDPALVPVVDRLEREHHEIAAVLEQVDRSLVALVQGGGVDDVRGSVDALAGALLPHLRYEEEQLVPVLNNLGLGI